ncbi:urease accessory protein [Fusarium subglutinans]|uniref:Urease accessory protein n=5 Tax=Fusarium fujikuroi species complex TaxID=171627 RepID=A0A8H5Q3E6_GIBSU|nr:urease accessory protein [Fusarium subglutinans]KAF5606831.1 urease accessory protein [Fusarium subglutinans]
MPSTKNTTAQTPGYPLTCTVMAKPTKDNQTPGYPLTCSVMKKPAANGQTPGYPLTCTVMSRDIPVYFNMPHKHKRKRGDDEADFNLPPTQRARPLQVGKKKATTGKGKKEAEDTKDIAPKTKKGKKARKDNDAPRAFRRLMSVAQGKKVRSGLDNGEDTKTAKQKAEDLKIRPGEDLRAFAQRVDASLPVAGLTKKTAIKDGKDEQGFKVYRTRKERNMHKLYAQWREEERKIQEQKEEEADEEIGRELDEDPTGAAAIARATLNEATGKRARRKGGKVDDPWEELKKKRAEAKIAVHDQAQAPPELNKNLTKQIKIKDATADVENIPKAAGSLKRREELQEARADVLEAYRKIREHEQAKLLRAGL